MASPILNARVTPDTLDRLTVEAERRGITRSDLLRQAVASILDPSPPQADGAT